MCLGSGNKGLEVRGGEQGLGVTARTLQLVYWWDVIIISSWRWEGMER